MVGALADQARGDVSIAISRKRKEDIRFLKGTSKYVADVNLPDTLYASFVRSRVAHAVLRKVDLSDVRNHPKVRLALSAKDILDRIKPIRPYKPTEITITQLNRPYPPILAQGKLLYVGQPIAAIVAEDEYSALDAAELADIDYDPILPLVDPEKALESKDVFVYDEFKDNLAVRAKLESGDALSGFESSSTVLEERLVINRVAPAPMEGRAILASHNRSTGILDVWSSTQVPYTLRTELSRMLGLSETEIHVIAPDVGGGFGCKLSTYQEDVVVSFASMQLGRPVKWIETRTENLMTTTHGRDQIHYVKLGCDRNGKIKALADRIVVDVGAYPLNGALDVPTLTVKMITGCYLIRNVSVQLDCVYTNKMGTAPYRGAGRPEATYVIERMMDAAAKELKIDPVEMRMVNFIPREKMPYETPSGYVYDSGDYAALLKRLTEYVEYKRFREQQSVERGKGRLIGLGVSSYVEVCGFGPGRPENAVVRVEKTGRITVIAGTSPHGQGHETAFAEICAGILQLDTSDVDVLHSDTALLESGSGTSGSRSGPVGGTAVAQASKLLLDEINRVAAVYFKEDQGKVSYSAGAAYVREGGEKRVTLRELAVFAHKLTEDSDSTRYPLEAKISFSPPGLTFTFGSHLSIAEVDPETGKVSLLRYVSIDDCGKILNPVIVTGQIQGGVAQAIGQALFEEVVYDGNGQILTTNLMDYAVPTSSELINYESFFEETPTPNNPLGVKGVGEAGTIGCTPSVVNAVEDALRPLGIRVREMPLKPSYVWQLLRVRASKV